MALKLEGRTNTAYIKTADLQLNGNQINLVERPSSREQVNHRKKIARSLRPCTLRRPMSATPSFGYREMSRNKRLPPWSRPQSAGGASSLRRNKLAAKFSDSTLNDPDYMAEFGATYTMSSSQLLHSLMGSCSINEGLDFDTNPTPSPQPSLGDTIKAAAQLEPGLTGKPPLPPSCTTPQPRTDTTPVPSQDDIIALKFQRWFPEAVLESEVIKRTTLSVNPFEKQKDETDVSDAGTSVTDGAELSDRDVDKPMSGCISTFVKKSRIPKSVGEEAEKSILKNRYIEIKENVIEKKSPTIVVQEPDLYGCDIVTEEFYSERTIRSLTPEYFKSLKNPSNSLKGKNFKQLSLSDLNDTKLSGGSNSRSHSVQACSHSQSFKDEEGNPCCKCSKRFHEELDTVEACSNTTLKQNIVRNEIGSPANFETSTSKLRYTSTPIDVENSKVSPTGNFKDIAESSKIDNDFLENSRKSNFYGCYGGQSSYSEHNENYNNLSPPIKLQSENDAICHDHLNSQEGDVDVEDPDKKNKEIGEAGEACKVVKCDSQPKPKSELPEKHAHFTTEVQTFNVSPETEYISSKSKNPEEKYDWSKTFSPSEKQFLSAQRGKRDSESGLKDSTKFGSLETIKDSSRKSSKSTKEICRAASVPPFKNSKMPVNSKQLKDVHSLPQNCKRKSKRSMSHGFVASHDMAEKDSGVSSYEDIVTMIKVLEKEDLETPVITYKASPSIDSTVPEQSSSAKAILNFLDEVEKGSTVLFDTERSLPAVAEENILSGKEPPVSSRLGSLLNTDTPELAQQVMTLTLQLEEKSAVCKALEERYKQSVELLKQQKTESDETDRRHQRFIDELLKEKRQLAVQYETAMKEMEVKHENAVRVIEERHKVEMKKAQEKFNAAEKIRRDKWIDTKTKKIKELTVRGLEPELERMAASHQEELAELRRVHQRQLTEAESAWVRRTAALREQEAAERQTAVQNEREAARHRLEQEMCQVEKSYQEQRRRLLEEVRQEKELLQRQSERIIAEKQDEMAKQIDELKQKMQAKLTEYDKQHQEEIAKLKENLEAEKQAWISRQKGGLEEKEAALREELKRERDRHIELVIRRLESEAATKEQAIENKIKRLKECYDSEVNDLDATLKELRSRLKEARAELQKSEDNNATLQAQLSQALVENLPLKQSLENLRRDHHEAMKQNETKVAELQREISEMRLSFQEQINKIHNEKENQLQQVYTRVKEAISKKEEALLLVTKQRDTALEQCSRLEKLLETQRNHNLKL